MKPIAKSVARKPAVKVAKPAKGTPVDKLVIGKTYGYTSRTVGAEQNARGKLQEIDQKATGYWVKLHDKSRDVIITVRPTQIGASK